MLALFGKLRDGQTIEHALEQVYGVDIDGLEEGWRESIGAQPLRAQQVTPTAIVRPTPVPTYRPISAAPLAAASSGAPTPNAQPTSAPDTSAPAPVEAPAPRLFSNIIAIVLIVVALVVIAASGAVVALVRRRRRSAD